MSSTQQQSLLELFMEAAQDRAPAVGKDFAASIIWKDEEEFQRVLYYWSSRFRAIHLAKITTPVDAEFESSWEQYYGAEIVSF